ncbi:hypothetical protein RvY_02482-2 [Ramazzottius varieornatus]|nr:hypothetical protein RvY_02482-2 [Ramazzottius varieornatus]
MADKGEKGGKEAIGGRDAAKEAAEQKMKADIEYIATISSDLLKLKPDRVLKSFQAEEPQHALKEFLSRFTPILAITHGVQGAAVASNSLPTNVTAKWILFYLTGSGPGLDLTKDLESIVMDTNPCSNLLFYYDLLSEMSRKHDQEVFLPTSVIQENRTRLRRIRFETLRLSSQIDSSVVLPKPFLMTSVFPSFAKDRNILKLG